MPLPTQSPDSASSSATGSYLPPPAHAVGGDTVSEMRNALRSWKRNADLLRFVHAALTFTATVCSLLVAAKIKDQQSWVYSRLGLEWLSFGAAVSIGLLSAFDLGSKANRFRRAWRSLKTQLFLFQEQRISAEQLIQAYAAAEAVVGDVKEEPK